MAIAIDASEQAAFSQDRLSGASRTNVIDRWIYVFTAASFIAIVLAGFVPDSFEKLAAIQAGQRPPFPPILHFHAVLMGSFLLLLLGQTVLVATDKRNWHMQLGVASAVLVPALVIAGIVLVPTMYHQVWTAAQSAPPPVRQSLQAVLPVIDDILLLQLRVGLLFPILMWIALRSRARNSGLHKRLILLASAPLLAAAFDRIHWLPNTMPHSPLAPDIYVLLAVAPMFVWDLVRNRGLHRAYLIFAAFFIPLSAVVYGVWDTPWWHATARSMMGV
jgi:hypothetical protein